MTPETPKLNVESIDIDEESGEIVVTLDVWGGSQATVTVDIAEYLGALSDGVASHKATVPFDRIETEPIEQYLADLHDVEPGKIGVMRVDAPNQVHYEVMQDIEG